jgi:hypothetical protein
MEIVDKTGFSAASLDGNGASCDAGPIIFRDASP